ncbi:DUF1254 domain-containing protein [Bradyrhizobium sp. BRP22]|uniref:DUF1254 domain-containing protein n=1 Tax=Bradyrhizobium sp. BRP22 TaxID=2793821 RepID=UPI001CD2D339|nr:DUF1254 domain-containing protein [Bradyrhizobium sp. BRP22]MCA1455214.1 DUF1254 domain-containing protein [Bradyrhizobium sp. BRP22]
MPTRRDTLSLVPAGLLIAGGLANTTVGFTGVASASERPADIKRTRIGDLRYEAGFPTAETVKKLYDELDFQRAVLAYQYVDPLVAMNELNAGLQQAGGSEGDWYLLQHFLDPHGIALTGNSTTIYAMGFLDLRKNGPMVVEVAPGSYGAFFDLWQQTIAGVGPIGEDKGKGGKFLILPAGFNETVPEGYYRVISPTSLAAYFARGIVRNRDVAGAAKSLETTRIYPLSKRNDPPKTTVVLTSGKNWNSIAPEGFKYWERAAEVANYVGPSEDGAFLLSLLKSLGIEPGKPFGPDARMRQILTEASDVAWAIDQAISMAPRLKDVVYYPGTQWEFVLMLNPALRGRYWSDLEARINYYFQATMASPAMKEKHIGEGSQYLRSARDSKGDWLNGSNQYRLRVPANMPVREFWSVTVYDFETRSMIQTDTDVAAKSTYDKLATNGGGSIDLYFGPTAPAGKESNWIKTLPGRGWWVWFRLYGPTEAFFDKSWRLPDFEKV